MNFPPPSDKQSRVIWAAVTGLAVAALVGLLVALIWGLGKVLNILAPVLWPIAIAGVVACLLDPVVDFLERRKVPRTRAIVMVFGLSLLLVAGIAASLVPQLVIETRTLANRIPDYVSKVTQSAENWMTHPPAIVRRYLMPRSEELPPVSTLATSAPPSAVSRDSESAVAPAVTAESTNLSIQVLLIERGRTNVLAVAAPPARIAGADPGQPPWQRFLTMDNVKSVTAWMSDTLPKAGSWLFGKMLKVTSIFGVVAGLALIPVYAFYFLIEKRGISTQWQDYLPVSDSKFKEELVFVLKSINDYLIAFFRGQVLVAMCDGLLYTIGFLCIGLPYAVLIGALAVFLTIIPFIGAITVCLMALVIALVQFGDWLHPLLVLVVFGIVQALEGLVLQPKIMGNRVGLHPLAIIIALMVGTTLLGGILGGILAIPLTAALRVIMFRYVWKKREG